MDKTKNVFISHYHKNDPQLQQLKERFAQKGYKLRNSSIDSTKHDGRERRPSKPVIERLLRMRINWAGTFICLIGEKTHTRPWVSYEIQQAIKKGKQIIGVYTHGSKGSVDIPDELKDCGGQLFGWNSVDKIIDAIENNTQYQWENPDGSPNSPIYTLKTVSC